MAWDELISQQTSYLTGLAAKAWIRWVEAANRARTSAYTFDDLFDDIREQFVDQWDTWNQLMGLPIATHLPSLTIAGKWDQLKGRNGKTRVNVRLTNAALLTTPLEALGGANTKEIVAPDVGKTGTFDGEVKVQMTDNAPSAPAGTHDVYRGLALAQLIPGTSFEPIAWIVVIASKT